jgi:hypothetical protein
VKHEVGTEISIVATILDEAFHDRVGIVKIVAARERIVLVLPSALIACAEPVQVQVPRLLQGLYCRQTMRG